MNNQSIYSKMLARSVDHIFKNFLEDQTIREVYETQAKDGHKIAVEINGTIKGEIIIIMPLSTLSMIAKKFTGLSKNTSAVKHQIDVAGEIANLITGSFANQMQFKNHALVLSPPEFNDDPIAMKALYDNINLSFTSEFGGFDIDLYYKETA
ncbi:MAG: chemotaxis protein CheX [Leptospirales bacterium]|nr:chemotaxis protein CheX [Leptospirales bacterium]